MRPTGIRRLFRFPSRTASDVHDDVREEVAFHIEMRTQELVAEGLDPAEARTRALREFGNVARASASLRTSGTQLERRRMLARFLTELRQDAAYALRLIVRNKGFSAAAVLTVAVSIGGNTAMF